MKQWMMKSFLSLFLLFSFSVYSIASEFTDKILYLNKCIPFSVTSWIRSESRNEMVGGAETSFHITGLAVDIVLDDKTHLPLLITKMKELDLNYIIEDSHIHIDVGGNKK